MEDNTVKVVGVVSAVQDVSGAVVLDLPPLTGTVDVAGSILPIYDGEYTITPGDEEQVLQTRKTVLTENIVINPIPSNYGKITWNGSALTVS